MNLSLLAFSLILLLFLFFFLCVFQFMSSSGSAKVKVTQVVDPRIEGGYVVEFEGKMVDTSVRSRRRAIQDIVAKTLAQVGSRPAAPAAPQGVTAAFKNAEL